MIDVDADPDHALFREGVRGFCRRAVAPLVDAAEASESFPAGLFRSAGEAGYLCPTVPERYGGAGADTVSFCILAEELGRVCSGIAGSILAHSSIGTSAVLDYGDDEQRARYLPPAVRGEAVFAFAVTEPNVGSDLQRIEMKA